MTFGVGSRVYGLQYLSSIQFYGWGLRFMGLGHKIKSIGCEAIWGSGLSLASMTYRRVYLNIYAFEINPKP